MVRQSRSDLLADKLYVTVILRLLLGRRGRIEHGEIVDVNGTLNGRFNTWKGLVSTLRSVLATHEHDESVDPAAGDDR